MAQEETRYLSLADVIAIHQFVMERLGSSPAPLRDEGALESAIVRPQMAAYYEGADFVRQCALLAIGISQAQSFVDGNKRTAFAATRLLADERSDLHRRPHASRAATGGHGEPRR